MAGYLLAGKFNGRVAPHTLPFMARKKGEQE
jgi:hypothetical protein